MATKKGFSHRLQLIARSSRNPFDRKTETGSPDGNPVSPSHICKVPSKCADAIILVSALHAMLLIELLIICFHESVFQFQQHPKRPRSCGSTPVADFRPHSMPHSELHNRLSQSAFLRIYPRTAATPYEHSTTSPTIPTHRQSRHRHSFPEKNAPRSSFSPPNSTISRIHQVAQTPTAVQLG